MKNIKNALAPCTTEGEAQDVIANIPTKTLSEFVRIVSKAAQCIDLTMRDAFLLSQMRAELARREFYKNQAAGTFVTPVKRESSKS